MGADDERPSQPRLFVARAHEALGRFARRIEWLSEWISNGATAVVMLLVLSLAGTVWLPITGTVLDVLLWIAIIALGTAALAVYAWRERRRRHGEKPSSEITTRLDALSVVTSTWLGLGLFIAFVVDLSIARRLNGAIVFVGLLGLALLTLAGILVRRFIAEE